MNHASGVPFDAINAKPHSLPPHAVARGKLLAIDVLFIVLVKQRLFARRQIFLQGSVHILAGTGRFQRGL